MGCCFCTPSSKVGSAQVNNRAFYEKNVVVDERSCTDVFFFWIFVIYIFFTVISVLVAAAQSEPRRLIYGVDSKGDLCLPKNKQNQGQGCRGSLNDVGKTISSSSLLDWLNYVAEDISTCWSHILILCCISIGLTVTLMLIFRFFASCIIWIMLITVAVALIALTIYLWLQWDSFKNDDTKKTMYLVASIIATIITAIYLLLVFVMRKRIAMVGALFEEAGKAIGAMPFLLLQPLWTFIAAVTVWAFILVGIVCVQTSGQKVTGSNGEVTFPLSTFFLVFGWLLLLSAFWKTQFVIACQHLVVAGAVCKWYFSRDKRKLRSPILRSLYNTTRFHLGSAALGSLIIAIIQMIRFLFRLLQKYSGKQGERCEILWKICHCCLSCFESYIKFLSRNAYIYISMTGESFCTSCSRVFALLIANALRLAAVESVGDFVLFVGKIGVTVAIAFIGVEILRDNKDVNYVWIPIGISCIFSFLITHCFLSVYEMTIDTLLLCFCEDCERNDGISRPYYMGRSLMMLLEKNKKNIKLD